MARLKNFGIVTILSACAVLSGSGFFHAMSAPRAQPSPPAGPKGQTSDASGGKSVPLSTKSADKTADLDMDEWRHDEHTGVDTGRNFVYREGDTTVTGLSARYNGKSKALDAEGSLVLDDPKHHVTGDKAHVDNSKKKLAVITNHVIIVLKSESGSNAVKPETGSAKPEDNSKERKSGATITCDQVDDYYKTNQMILRGHLIFKQHIVKSNGETVDRTLTAEHAEYDGKTEKLKLFSPVAAHDTDEQDLAFTGDVFVGTKDGNETIETPGRTKGHFKVESNDQDQP